MDAVQEAGCGHPGLPMGAAEMGLVLWTRHLRHSPKNPNWFNRDRFVLSAGHGSMLLYALLHLTGYDLSLDELRRFRQWGSKTPGHPENVLTPGVEMATGPLGQGLATATGMAIAEKHLAARFNTSAFKVVDHHTYVICSDGDLMEGVTNEAGSLAGHLKLGKLIALYDDNGITIDGPTSLTFTEDPLARYAALGWHVQRVDGMDPEAVDRAIQEAKAQTDAPSLIACKTVIGFGSPNKAGSSKAHGAALGQEEVNLAKQALGIPLEPKFHVPAEVSAYMGSAVARGQALEQDWQDTVRRLGGVDPSRFEEFSACLKQDLPESLTEAMPTFEGSLSTRAASGRVLQVIADKLPWIVGGSADLAESNLTHLTGKGEFQPATPEGRNFSFGVREHAMACALNGMNLHGGLRAFGGTFLIFSDYCRPAIRLSALMETPTVFVFTHDSIGLGEDGPTHQPIEHIMSLRAIPNLNVMRPAGPNETAACWLMALRRTDGPTALVLTRQSVPVTTYWESDSDGNMSHPARFGGYVLQESAGGMPEVILIATGSEVHVALQAREVLQSRGVPTRVVSMPSWFLFERQKVAYRESVLPKDITAVSVEAGSTLGWGRYATGHVGLDHFGASAPGDVLLREFGFTADNVAQVTMQVLQAEGRAVTL